MNDYASIDGTIEAVAARQGARLYKGWGGRPARYFYVNGKRAGECFIIIIFPPAGNGPGVRAASVETDDGTQMQQEWTGPVRDIGALLERALATVAGWIDRTPALRS